MIAGAVAQCYGKGLTKHKELQLKYREGIIPRGHCAQCNSIIEYTRSDRRAKNNERPPIARRITTHYPRHSACPRYLPRNTTAVASSSHRRCIFLVEEDRGGWKEEFRLRRGIPAETGRTCRDGAHHLLLSGRIHLLGRTAVGGRYHEREDVDEPGVKRFLGSFNIYFLDHSRFLGAPCLGNIFHCPASTKWTVTMRRQRRRFLVDHSQISCLRALFPRKVHVLETIVENWREKVQHLPLLNFVGRRGGKIRKETLSPATQRGSNTYQVDQKNGIILDLFASNLKILLQCVAADVVPYN